MPSGNRTHGTTETIDIKNVFYVFFILVKVFFYLPNVFYFKKNVGKVQSGKQINKKHFQNNSNEIDHE